MHANSIFTRLLLWYTIITTLFRCPSSFDGLTPNSPRVCKPYLKTRSYLTPYIEPYYSAYAAPHLDKARPYFEKANEQLYVPVASYSQQYYTAFLAPKVEQALGFSREKWNNVVKPQVDTAQTEARKQYDSNLAPHVDKASAAAAPYVTASRENAYQVYIRHVLPTYGSIQPYLQKAYVFLHAIVVKTGLPYAQEAWASTVIFFNRTLWPKLSILYGENVEPQLVRIGERLGRYRDGKKIQAILDDIDSTTSKSTTSPPNSSIASSIIPNVSSPSSTSTPASTPEQDAQHIRNKIESDLKNWQGKFTRAAEKGMEDLEERIKRITDRQIEHQVGGTGQALLIQLEESIGSEEGKLKKKITSLVDSLPEDTTEESLTASEDKLSKATREAGLSVKEKAQALRTWRENLDQETLALVSAATKSTLEVIDNIRDLGLQEIGMKWANMEGVTYKDWSRYHEAKKSFDEWHKRFDSITPNHLGVRQLAEAGDDLEAKGMETAKEAAMELGRLKEVGRWKIQAKDTSDDFSKKHASAATIRGVQQVVKVVSSASEQVAGSSHNKVQSIMPAVGQKADDFASAVSSQSIETEAGFVEQAASTASEGASIASEKVSEGIVRTSQGKPQSIVSAIQEKTENLASGASETILGTPQTIHQSVASQASEKVDSADMAISEAVAGSSSPTAESASSDVSAYSSSISSVTSEASKKVLGGAMAQEVKAQKPILDSIVDEGTTYSEKLQSLVDQAGDKYADVTKAVSEAIIGATKTQGTVESASSIANEQYQKALSAASSVIYGTEQGTAESVTSVASEKWAEAVGA